MARAALLTLTMIYYTLFGDKIKVKNAQKKRYSQKRAEKLSLRAKKYAPERKIQARRDIFLR